MKKICFVALFFLLGFVFASYAADEKLLLSVDDAVKLAKENNISLKRSEINLNAALRSKNHSWNSVSPTLSLGASSSVPLDFLTSGDQESKYDASAGVSASLSLNLTANLYSQIISAKNSYEQQKVSFEDAVRSIELTVRQTFFGLLYEKENIKLQKQNLEIARIQFENNRTKYNSGRLSEVDALSAEVNYKSKIPTVENAVTVYENDLDSFKQVLALPPEKEIELTGSLDDMLFLEEISVDKENINSSAIRALELKIEDAENSVLDKRFSAYAPVLRADVSWKNQYWYLGGTEQYEDAKASKSASASLSVSIPLDGILPWSSKNDAVDSAKETLKDLHLQLEDQKIDVMRSVDSELRSIKQRQSAIKYSQANIALAQKNYDMIQEAYNRGAKDLLALQNANNTLLTAQVSFNSEILALTKSILKLEEIIGVDFCTLTK